MKKERCSMNLIEQEYASPANGLDESWWPADGEADVLLEYVLHERRKRRLV
jgi:hypothetical protein